MPNPEPPTGNGGAKPFLARSRRLVPALALAAATVIAVGTADAFSAGASPAPSPQGPSPRVVQGGGGHMQAGGSAGSATGSGPIPQAAPAAGTTSQPAAAAGAASYSVKGVDVASWQQDPNCQTPLNWSQVRGAGYSFALVKATEGTTYTNPCFNAQYNGAKGAGMYTAAYAFARPDSNTPVQQADYLMQNAQFVNDGKTLPLMLDLEGPGSGDACWAHSTAYLAAWVRAFVNEVRAKSGKPMIIYTSAGWWNQCLSGYTGSFTDQWLDVASWTTAANPTLPAGWSVWTFWQYTSTGTVAGIKGAVDLDVYKGSISQLAQLAAKTSAAGTARPAVVSPAAGELATFYRGFDGNLWWIHYLPEKVWSTPESLGYATLGSDPAVASPSSTSYDVFWRASDGRLAHAWSTDTGWASAFLGGSVSGTPVASADANGDEDVLWRGTDGGLWSTHQTSGGTWSAITQVPGVGQICSAPASIENSTGALDVFWRGCDNGLWTVHRPSANAGWSSGRVASCTVRSPRRRRSPSRT